MHSVTLRNAFLRADIVPAIGAGLARLDALGAGAPVPVLRGFDDAGQLPRPNQLACFALLPWSNRLAGGFTCDNRSYRIAPNRAGDPYPMHGEGWLLPWQVEQQSDTDLSLLLEQRAAAPFSYSARIGYALRDASLVVTLAVTNRGDCALPFGLGLHPWMPRSAAVTLRAAAGAVWLNGADRLPVQAVAVPPAWQFAQRRALPATQVDHVFDGWDGCAEIAWPDRGISLRIDADCSRFILYAPEGGDVFCFEPVDHVINAHNLAGGPEHNGLTMLAPAATLRRRFSFSVDQFGALPC